MIGDGSWGTTLAIYLTQQSYRVKLWGPFPQYIQEMRRSRYNQKFLPGIRLPQALELVEELDLALQDSDLVVFAIPSQYATQILAKLKGIKINWKKLIFLSVTKGIDTKSLLCISQIIRCYLGKIPLAILSGPTISREVAEGIPTTAVVAAQDIHIAQRIQKVFNSQYFRIYTNTDVLGVELGGSIKNVIAIACGVCDGLKLGTNTKAAIITRGLAEMARLGKALGARAQTFMGLTGLGDLATTCFSPQSRNRYVGEQLGQGKSIRQIVSSMDMVAEGVETVKAVYQLSCRHKVNMPITEAVYQVIYKNKKSTDALMTLMNRMPKSE